MTGKDFLGQDINAGDTVFAYQLKYRNPVLAKVKKVTNKMVFLKSITKTNLGYQEFKQYQPQVLNVTNMVKDNENISS